jgi:hypothetical protein
LASSTTGSGGGAGSGFFGAAFSGRFSTGGVSGFLNFFNASANWAFLTLSFKFFAIN